MGSMKVVVVHELCKTLGDGNPTANPGVVVAVDPHFVCVKPLFDEVSINVVEMTAQIQSKEGSQIAVAIDKELSI
jgi:hypothetical protein